MIDVKIARRLLGKFKGMNSAPKNREELELRAESLARKCGSEAHAEAVCEALLERLVFFPNVADLMQACANTEDPASSAAKERRRDCPYCRGEGWRTVDGPFGLSAAYPCNHTAAGDPRMGVKIDPALGARYMQEARQADTRREAWLRGRAEKHNPGFQRITHNDVNAILAATEADIATIKRQQEEKRKVRV